MPDTDTTDTGNTAPAFDVAGGYGLTRDDVGRLYGGQPAVRDALLAQIDRAEAGRAQVPPSPAKAPCCPECAEADAARAAALAQELSDAERALAAAEGLPAA